MASRIKFTLAILFLPLCVSAQKDAGGHDTCYAKAGEAAQPACLEQKGIEIIALAKAVTGGGAWDKIEIWHETGHSVTPAGRVSQYEHWGDFRSLKLRNISRNTKLTGMVYDGSKAYSCTDPRCEVPMEMDSRGIREGSYVASFGFFFRRRFPAMFFYQGTASGDGTMNDVVKVTPEGMDALDIWVSQRTHLITRIVYAEGQFHDDLSDYRKVGPLTVPFVTNGNLAKVYVDTLNFEPAGVVDFSLQALGHRP